MSKPNADKPSSKSKPKNAQADKARATDISLINGKQKPRRYKKSDVSFFMQRGYQILLVLGLIAAFVLFMIYQTLFGRISQPETMVTIEQGDTYYGLLPDWQPVTLFSPTIAKMYIKATINAPLHAGIYKLPENPSLVETLHVLEQGAEVAMVKVQIIEGKTAKDLYQTLRDTKGIEKEIFTTDNVGNNDIASALDLAGVLPERVLSSSDDIVNHNLEGWFAPDTYYYGEGASDKQILTDLYKRQQQTLTEAWEGRDKDLPYDSPYEALIMASIIEKETSVPDERPLVAAVFINRLEKGMRMQTDPTIIYGMGARYDGNIRRRDIDETTSYNTYQIDGLPPTPIALPSAESIKAAMHPADSDALYFVATGNGGHKFTNSLNEHNRAVQEYLKVIRNK
ncbi:endolytic transglycosylase MltG [Psychrobacter aestuarii]|uniref:Endolytic murein transglycosylase n=1 Tax=Psychrobacter aestuarii TaxID=556327 RepID=A0ABN0W1X8_9GAMM|nr:endolytic transglycosylase MltG [Psychrobacter aestuarii]